MKEGECIKDERFKQRRIRMIIDRFEEQVKKYPDHVAIKTVRDVLTYQELNDYANVVAREINDKRDVLGEVGRGTVALLFEHGSDMIVGKMGALKAAKIYVPMDPSYPSELLAYMLEDCEPAFVITNDKMVEFAESLIQESNRKAKIININQIKRTDFQEFTNPKCKGDEIAYILYTSGSTGKPKGVMQSHRNVLHFAECYRKAIDITPEDRMTLLSSFSHDAGIGDICAALLNGASLYPLDVKSSLSINEMANWLRAERITIWYSVPTLYRHFMNTVIGSDEFPSLRFIILGGESVLPNDINLYRKTSPSAKFAIMYGQTESSINSFQIFTADCQIDEITLGVPVLGTEIVVVNENGEEVAPLRIGEILILSDYVALGYWKDEEKSKEVFEDILEVGRAYWTGDLGKLLLDGSIEFIGRKDFQVKIRGNRVELGGIENQLLEHHAVKEAVVIARAEASGDNYLCAYIVTDEIMTVNELYEYLSSRIPEYMIPQYFMQLEEMPLTPNGKIDRKALLEFDEEKSAEYAAPRNRTEGKLAQIWSEVLGRERVGIYDNFFELGGHSLKGTVLVLRIQKELNVDLQLKELFRAQTIAELSKWITDLDENVYEAIKEAAVREHYETSYAQKRIWRINQLNPASSMFNTAIRVTLYEEVDSAIIQKIFDKLTSRHEAFRTRFEELSEGALVQVVDRKSDFVIDKVNLSLLPFTEREQARMEIYGNLVAKVFNLQEEHLINVKLLKISEREYDLIYCMHHIITDGWSMDILKKEISMMYEAYKNKKECKLSPLRIQYKDFAEWQNKVIENKQFSEIAKAFWMDQLRGEIPMLNLPVDYSAKDAKNKVASAYRIVLSEHTKDKLKGLALELHTSLFIVLITTFISFLTELTKQDDILIGLPVFGREHEDLQNVIGCFANTIIIRNKINREDSFVEMLDKIDKNIFDALRYQDYPLELIVEELDIEYPEISAFFNMLNFNESANVNIVDLDSAHIDDKTQGIKFDLGWYVTEYWNGIQIVCTYSTGLFKPKTIENIMNRYTDYVKKILETPHKYQND